MEILYYILASICAVFVLPILAFLIAKYVMYGVLAGRAQFNQDRKHNGGNRNGDS